MKKFTLGELEEIFERLQEVYNNYLKIPKTKLCKTISSADGSKINIFIPINAVAHLLGIDTNCYKAIFSSKESSSNKILEEILDRGAYNLFTNASKIGFDLTQIISPYIVEKLNNFENMLWLDIEKIEFICHYDKKKSYNYNVTGCDFDHLIVTKIDDSNYSFITLSDNITDKGIITIPRSNQLICGDVNLKQKLSNILENQAITIATLFSFNNNDFDNKKMFFLKDELKKEKIKNARIYCRMYNCNLDVSYDYLNILRFSNKKADLSKVKKNYLELIANAIKTDDIITEEYLNVSSFSKLPVEIVLIIYEYNNFLLRNGTNEKIKVKYSDMNKVNEELRIKNNNLEDKLKQLESEIEKNNYELKIIQKENQKLNEKINEVKKVLG